MGTESYRLNPRTGKSERGENEAGGRGGRRVEGDDYTGDDIEF